LLRTGAERQNEERSTQSKTVSRERHPFRHSRYPTILHGGSKVRATRLA
jgi:hypothetical protein